MAQRIRTPRGSSSGSGGGGITRRSSLSSTTFILFLARELTRPRFRTLFLGVGGVLIILLLRLRNMPTTDSDDVTPPPPPPPPPQTSTAISSTESKTNMRLYNRNNSTTTIPRTIYIFWSSGWPSNRVEGQLVRRSWEYFNEGYFVHCLDFHEAELMTDRRRYIPDAVFHKMNVQARSDVYRTLILFRYGGVWVDASLFCNSPLDSWLDLNQTDLFSFVRNDKLDKQKGLDIRPWVTSWFLAAPKESYILSRVVEVLSNATEQEKRLNKKWDYFWWHRIVSDLARQDAYIMNRIQTLFKSADPLHCKEEGFERTAPVMKRCGNNKMYSTFATAHVCCTPPPHGHGQPGDVVIHYNRKKGRDIHRLAQATANLTQQYDRSPPMDAAAWKVFCAGWNCTMHSRNMHRIDDFKRIYGEETFAKLPFILYSE